MAALLSTNKLRYGSPTRSSGFRVERFATDSYSVRATKGINAENTEYELEWAGLTTSEATALKNQLTAAKGVDTVDWQPPLESGSQKFTVSSFSINEYPGDVTYYSVIAMLMREYDL